MLIAQISDFHVAVRGEFAYTKDALAAAVSHLLSLKPHPDVVVATGDLTESGEVAEYELLVKLFEPLPMPVYFVAGNHDSRREMRDVLKEHGYDYLPDGEFLQYAVDLGPLRLIALDTVIPQQPQGRLCPERLSWLDRELSDNNKPTILLQHHPPYRSGLSCMDAMGLTTVDQEREVVSRYEHVEAVLSGHLHRFTSKRFAGTIAYTAPSPAHALKLDLRNPGQLAVLREPPMCLLHHWEDGALVTHASFVQDFGPARVLRV